MEPRVSFKTSQFTESVIREMSRLAEQHGAVNLAQGFPDFPAPADIKEAARRAIAEDINQYAITWGARKMRAAVARKYSEHWGLNVDPEREVTICCGSTEAMIASCLALLDPGDEVVIFEPFYENYGPDIILSGAVPRRVPLHYPDWSFDPQQLAAAFTPRTRAIIVNTPNNPTGKVFTAEELECIAALCIRWNAVAITDEIYEHMVYDGGRHHLMCLIPGMRERTVTINSISKTYSLTGWRVGYTVACERLSRAIRKVHDFLTVGAAAPLQEAAVCGLEFSEDYYRELLASYQHRRDLLYETLQRAGFRGARPQGAYYIMSDISGVWDGDDCSFVRWLIEDAGVAAVPGSSFYAEPVRGSKFVRVCFCKKEETLRLAGERLQKLETRPAGQTSEPGPNEARQVLR